MNATLSTRKDSTRTNLWIDAALFAAVLIAFQPRLSGLAIHEWLSLSFGAGILTHVALHWRWVVNVVRRFFQRLSLQTRLYAVLNLALLTATFGVMISGIMLSEIALPALGITLSAGPAWHAIHSLSANAIVALSMLHVAVHWKWILNAVNRYVIRPIADLINQPAAAPTLPTAPMATSAPTGKSARSTNQGIAGWALSLASLAWLVGMFGGWLFAAVQSNADPSTSTPSSNVTTSTQSNTTAVQSFTARTRSSQ